MTRCLCPLSPLPFLSLSLTLTLPCAANTWTAYVAVFRTLDFSFKAPDGAQKHVQIVMSDEDVALLRKGFQRFTELVREYTGGELEIAYTLDVIEEPLTHLSGEGSFWLGPADVADLLKGRFEPGKTDSLFGYVKLSDGKDQTVPAAMFGGTYGGDMDPSGAGWTGIMWYPGWMKGDGEVELHEWLHQVDWAFAKRLGYPDALVPSPDDGRVEGAEGGDLDYRRPKQEQSWLGFYRHLMTVHITPEMWREARCRPWEGTEFNRTWLVLGPFCYEGEVGPALEGLAAWDANKVPTVGEQVGELSWRRISSDADLVDLDTACADMDYACAYAFATVRSDREQDAALWLGYDDSIIAYVNGEEVFGFIGPTGASKDQASAPIHLKQGPNLILVKVADIAQDWGFCARLGDTRGRGVGGVKWEAP